MGVMRCGDLYHVGVVETRLRGSVVRAEGTVTGPIASGH